MSGAQSSNSFIETPSNENPYQFDLNGPSQPKRRRTDSGVNSSQLFHQQEGGGQEPGNSNLFSLHHNSYGSDYVDCSLTVGHPGPITSLSMSLPEDQNGCHAGTASTGREMFSLYNDLWAEINQQEDNMNKLIQQQEENCRELLKLGKRHVTGLANKIKRLCAQKFIQKDLELEQMFAKNRDLVEKVDQAEAEARHWKFQALQSQATAHTLQAEAERGRQELSKDDAASGVAENEGGMSTRCCVCKREKATILHLPCHHLSVCPRCDQSLEACPICFTVKSQSISAIFP